MTPYVPKIIIGRKMERTKVVDLQWREGYGERDHTTQAHTRQK